MRFVKSPAPCGCGRARIAGPGVFFEVLCKNQPEFWVISLKDENLAISCIFVSTGKNVPKWRRNELITILQLSLALGMQLQVPGRDEGLDAI